MLEFQEWHGWPRTRFSPTKYIEVLHHPIWEVSHVFPNLWQHHIEIISKRFQMLAASDSSLVGLSAYGRSVPLFRKFTLSRVRPFHKVTKKKLENKLHPAVFCVRVNVGVSPTGSRGLNSCNYKYHSNQPKFSLHCTAFHFLRFHCISLRFISSISLYCAAVFSFG